MSMLREWFGRQRRTDYIWLALFSCALGLAISLTTGLHYKDIWSSPETNYLSADLNTFLRGVLFGVPVFAITSLLCALCERNHCFAPWKRQRMTNRTFFVLVWMIILISWLPYLLTFYPGGVVGDGAEALEYAIQTDQMDSRWGAVYIIVLRVFLAIGRLFSPDVNLGIYLYAMCSTCLYAAACSAVITMLRKKGFAPILTVSCVFVYAFFGHYASYGMCLWKDGLFGAGLTCLALVLWDEPEEQEKQRAWLIKTGGITLFLCFWRNFISYGVLIVGLLLLIKKNRRALAAVLLIVAVFSMIIQGPVFRAVGITGTGGTQEKLAIPIQQVAAAISAGAELTPEQEETLYVLLPKTEWLRLYAPACSDPVKFAIDEEELQTRLGRFLSVWLQLFLKMPNVYVKAWLMETLGFWQPYGSNRGFYYDWFVGIQDLYGRGYENNDLILRGTGVTLSRGLRDRLTFIPSGTMVWILLLSVILILCGRGNRKKKVTVLLPFVLPWVVILFTAPIAYSSRYVEMLAVGLPVIIALPLEKEKTEGEKVKLLFSRRATQAACILGAMVVVVVTLLGTYRLGDFENGRLIIETAGEGNLAKYYIPKGLSRDEGTFAWTLGNEMKVQVPRSGKGQDLEVTIYVVDTFDGEQRYTVLDGQGNSVVSGSLEGAGEIRFPIRAEGNELTFRMQMPDAAVVSERQAGSTDDRMVAFQIDRIEMRQAE